MYETYKCPICKSEFSTPEELRLHRMKVHKGQSRELKSDLIYASNRKNFR